MRVLSTAEIRRARAARAEFVFLPRTPASVLLDGVQRGANIGAVFRIADALRLAHVHLIGAAISLDARAVRQTSRRLVRWVPHTRWDTSADALTALRSSGTRLVAVELTSGSRDFRSVVLEPPVCFMLGGETAGLSQALIDAADDVLFIPQFGMGNSLNISTCVAAVAYHHALPWAEAIDGRGTERGTGRRGEANENEDA